MLKDSGLGCHIGTNSMGAAGYADDIALIAPSVMIDLVVLMMSHLMSPNISLFIFCNYRDEFNSIYHNDFFIKKSDFTCHLGNVIGPNPDKLYDLVINKFITCFNGLNVMFRKASVNVKYHLFKTFCMNLYGNLFWDLRSEKVTSFHTLWR